MTVAAVIVFPAVEDALVDTAGRLAVRRMIESAWAGGATPIVVVSNDPDGGVAGALAGSPAVLAEPAPPDAGVVGQVVRGIRVAAQHVVETEAVLFWPGDMVWVDAETVTTLIEAHGMKREALLRPRYGDTPGWPVLLPMSQLALLTALPPTLNPAQIADGLAESAVGAHTIDTGDPGATIDGATPIDALPDYQGPPEPVKPPPDWGPEVVDFGDEGPLQGPALAPYSQAAEDGE